MLRIFAQKYPAPSPAQQSITTSLLFGLFISLFLLFFEPFDINLSANENKVFQLFFFGCITTTVLVIFLYFLPLFFPQVFSDAHWKVKHQVLFYVIILLLIATFNGIYTNYINDLALSWYNYWWIISRTFVLGGIPIAFLTLLNYQRKTKLYENEAQALLYSKGGFTYSSNKTIQQFTTDLKNETITFNEENFNYALAVGNYIDVYSLVDNTLKKTTYRISLSSFERQLGKSANLLRCHRSYLVNLNKVENILGNAQGLKLELKNQSEIVPVSRTYIPLVRQFFLKNR